MRRILTTTLILRLILTAGIACSQSAVSSLNGSTSDSTKALIPGVTITLTNIIAGVSRKLISDNTGGYEFTNVPIGTYRLTDQFSGFKRTVINNVPIVSDYYLRVNIELQGGPPGEDVEINYPDFLKQQTSGGIKQSN